jgi:allantoinase
LSLFNAAESGEALAISLRYQLLELKKANFAPVMLIQHHKASEYQDRAVDQFEQLYHDARQSARVMALVVHPYIMGVPHRLKYFRNALAHIRAHDGVLCWTGEQILDWYLGSR